MKRLLALVILPLTILCGCTADVDLIGKFERLAEDNVGHVLDLGIATPFKWDEFAVFTSYYPNESACQTLGLSAWSCFWLEYPRQDDAAPNVVAFLNKGVLVHTALLPRCKVRLVPSRGSGVNVKARRQDGRFLVVGSTEGCRRTSYHLVQQ